MNDRYNTGRVLITGGAGFIGSHIAERLQGRCRVRILDDLSSGYKENLEGLDVELVEGDVRDVELVDRACDGVDAVFHLAARISVPESMQNPAVTLEVNTLGSLNVLQAALRRSARSLVFSSSSAVYGDSPVVPKTEEMIPEPKSPYALSKLDGEHLLRMLGGLRAVSLRYFNVFGPRQDPSSAYAAVIPAFIDRALSGQDLVVYGDGEQTRDFVYVDDVVEANLLAAGIDPAGPASGRAGSCAASAPVGAPRYDVYNVARGGSLSVNDLAHAVIDAVGSSSKIRYEAERPGDVRHSQADVSRLATLKRSPAVSLEEGLRRTVAYFRERR